MNTTVESVTSADGTRIALEWTGSGPSELASALERTGSGPSGLASGLASALAPVILIGGAYNDRSTMAALAATLAPDFTVITYDRRGRGDSTNNDRDFDVNREFDDLAAVIERAGGRASVFGHSSGGVLAAGGALRGLPIDRLAVYEPSYIPGTARHRPSHDLYQRLIQLIGQDRRDDAVALFQTEAVGLPAAVIEGMRASDHWGWFTGLAHTLPYDVALHGDYEPPAERLAALRIPVLAVDGSNSEDWVHAGTRAVADAAPGGRYVTLDGQDHGVLHHPEALRPVLSNFLAGR